MLEIYQAPPEDFEEARSFYHRLIDMMEASQYERGGEKGYSRS